jgi:uncharacterized protein with NRDE domain
VCTLIVLHGCVPGTPLAVGANRDEFFGRPAEGPALRKLEFGAIVAPLDIRAGGTWLGVNEYGLFAALTNRPMQEQEPDPKRRSRGLLVLDALREQSAIAAMEKLEQLPAEAYNSFNLLVADRDSIHVVSYDERVSRVELSSGSTVIGNSDPAAPTTPKLARLSARAHQVSASRPGDVLDELAKICRSHDIDGHDIDGHDIDGHDSQSHDSNSRGNALRSACVHAGDYGTRSSTLIRFGEDPRDTEFRFTDRAPCESEYRDYTPLLHELADGCQLAEGQTAARIPG